MWYLAHIWHLIMVVMMIRRERRRERIRERRRRTERRKGRPRKGRRRGGGGVGNHEMPCTSYILFHFIFTTSLKVTYYYHFTDENTRVQRTHICVHVLPIYQMFIPDHRHQVVFTSGSSQCPSFYLASSWFSTNSF